MTHPLILMTGMSGAGRSTALKILEDQGFEAIDNLPLSLLAALITHPPRRLAVGIDVRTQDFTAPEIQNIIHKAFDQWETQLVFLDCQDEVLIQRYISNRRRHPLSSASLHEAIQVERLVLKPVRDIADYILDTSHTSTIEFSHQLRKLLAPILPAAPLHIEVLSFSYRFGLPIQADIVLDARFLPNPYYDPLLRHQTGQDPGVIERLAHEPAWQNMQPHWQSMLTQSLEAFAQHGRSYVTIAFGCTGGQHRSVFVAEQLSKWLANQGQTVSLSHRDLSQKP